MMDEFIRIYPLIKQLQTEAQRYHDIKSDLAEFDGDRRGHYAALEESQEEVIDLVLNIFPDKYAEQIPTT